ncbi:hydroxymethylpyrimidine/phosphomethylpyrimidine kinase [Tenacibaculum maritimum]|uniref:hydroxymethylpyrimidine/phosphomethylpyrimidine kinase n=1 Tax=Tenacibaculum maritimum TaxID=107401 RepID=UPI0038760115
MKRKQYILTIAGLDPSGGAGITSDIKTFEAHNAYGLSVCTAITVQHDLSFKSCTWIAKNLILSQIDILFERFTINVVKIGIIQSWEFLLEVVQKLKELKKEVKIILDPVLKASTGFDFHHKAPKKVLEEVLANCYFITPNYEEIKTILPEKNIAETIRFISQKTNIYLKGGHRIDKKGWDEVYYDSTLSLLLPPVVETVFEKHGSGCVLSAALACNLAKGYALEDACRNAKSYIDEFLSSNQSLLGTHTYKNVLKAQYHD